MAKSIKHKMMASIIWTSLQKYSTMIIQLISGIILARLLTPYDYGCIGMLSIFMVVSEAFIDGGFGSALIQKKKPTQVDYSTIFFWNIAVSILMYAILYLSAPAIARFYNIDELSAVLRVQAIVLFIYALNIVQKNQLKKKLNFKILSIISIITAFISLTVTIIMAYKGYGVWSLVTQHLLVAGIPALIFWFYCRWRPTWTFSLSSFKTLFNFGFYMFLTHLLNNFSRQIQGLLIGKFYSASTMGYYSKAQTTEKLASTSISSIMTQITYPFYAKVQDNLPLLQNMIKRLTTSLTFVTFPLLFLLLLLAKPIFLLLYTDRWLQSIPYFQVLCISGMAFCLQSVNNQSIAAIGKSKVMFIWMVLKRLVGLTLLISGLLLWGMKGLLLGVVIASWFSYSVNISLVSKYIGYKWSRQILDLMPSMLVSILAAVICYGLGLLLGLPMYLDALVKLLIFATVYIGWAVIFRPEPYEFLLGMLPNKFRPKRLRNSNKTFEPQDGPTPNDSIEESEHLD